MPRVPRVEEMPGGVRPAPVPDVAFPDGTAIGRGMQDLGQGVQQVARALADRQLRLKQQEDANKAWGAYTDASAQVRNLLEGTDDAPGLLHTRGEDALDITRVLEERLAEVQSRAGKDLTPSQHSAYMAMFGRRAERALDAAARHSAVERRTYNQATAEAVVASTIEDIRLHFADPAAREDALLAVETVVRSTADGEPAEVTTQKVEKVQASIHVEVVRAMMVDNPTAAKEYLQANEKAIGAGADITALRAQVKDADITARAQAATDALFAEPLSATERLARARQEEDPALREELVQRVKLRTDEQDRLQRQSRQQQADQAWGTLEDIVDSGGDTASALAVIRAVEDPGVRQSMRSWLSEATKGVVTRTDPEVYYGLVRMTPDQFAAVDLRQHFHQLSPADREKLMDAQAKVLNREPTTLLSNAQVVTQFAEGAKLNDKDAALYSAWVESEVAEIERREKRAVTREELRDIAQRGLLVGAENLFSGWFSDRRLFHGDDDFVVEDVPEEDRQQIIEAHRAAGRGDPSEAVIQRLYTRKVTGG